MLLIQTLQSNADARAASQFTTLFSAKRLIHRSNPSLNTEK